MPGTSPPRHDHRHQRTRPAPWTERISGWSARHRKTAVFGWLLLVVVVFAIGNAAGSKTLPSYDPGQSGQAERTLHSLTGTDSSPPAEEVLIQSRTGTWGSDPALRQAAQQVTAALTALPGSAAGLRSPLSAGGGALVSADRHSALVTFTVPGDPAHEDTSVAPALRAVAAIQAKFPQLVVAEAGDASGDRAQNQAVSHDFRKAGDTSLPVTLLLLLVVFGALIAAGIPVLLALSAVLMALSLLQVIGHWLPVAATTSQVILIIGMAVGVDYSLFYLRRMREERAEGRPTAEALRIAASTSGHAITVSGLTVMLAVAGLFLTGLSLFDGMALGSIVVVGIAVTGSLTVLPALLSWLGPWADRGRIPYLGRRRAAGRPSKTWGALAGSVVRHPVAWGSIAAIFLLTLASPALGLRLGYPATDLPKNLPVLTTAHEIQRAFPQSPSPAEVVVTGTHLTGPAVSHAITALQQRAAAGGPIRPPVTATSIAGGRALIITVPLAGTGTGTVSDHALVTLRSQILPSTLGQVPGLRFTVTGDTASSYDLTTQLHSRTPMVLAAVALLAFLLLLVAFRSVTIPLVSIVLNLLSVGAAYGIITWVFQDGRLQGPLDYTGFGAIIPWEPLFMFVFLFGMSMDYHVFILSRIREHRLHGESDVQAVTNGIATSAGVVTSAALVMVAVFSIFATLSLVDLKILGVGMAAAILLDATIVRGILLPAALALLGDRAWYLPRWLRWLPAARA